MDYQAITREDLPELVRIIQEDLTHGDAIGQEIREYAAAGAYYGVKAVEDGALRGFLTYKRGIGLTYPHPEVERRLADLCGGESVFSGDALVVLPGPTRHRGVASELCRRCRDQAMALGGKYMVHELWTYPDGTVPGWKPVEEFGEVVYQEEIPLFYRDMARYGMECPICGKNCRCGAVIWLQRLRDKGEQP